MGRMSGLNVELSGRLEGDGPVWQEPRLTVQAQARSRLGDLREAVEARWPAVSGRLPAPLDGNAQVRLELRTPLTRLDQADVAGTLAVSGLETSVTLTQLRGPLRVEDALVRFSDRSVVLERANGRLGEVRFSASGAASPPGGELELQVAGEFPALAGVVPALDFYMRTGGAFDSANQAAWTLADAQAVEWSDVAALLETADGTLDLSRKRLAEIYTFVPRGEIQLTDADLTYAQMPTPLRMLNGKLVYEGTRLWSPEPLQTEGGEHGRDLQGMVELTAGGAGEAPRFRFDVIGGHFR